MQDLTCGASTLSCAGGRLPGGHAGGADERRERIGAIGGLAIPPVDRFIDGYWYGARCANPAVTTWITYTNSFDDPGQGDAVARYMINHGADVIDGVAGGTGSGALLAAAELGRVGYRRRYLDEYYTTFQGGAARTGADPPADQCGEAPG